MQRLHELIYRSSRSFTFYSQYHKYLFATSYYTNKRERERYEIIYYINYSSINRTLIILKYKLNNASQTNVKSRHLSENAREERIGRAQLHKTQLLLSLSFFLCRSFFLSFSISLSPSRRDSGRFSPGQRPSTFSFVPFQTARALYVDRQMQRSRYIRVQGGPTIRTKDRAENCLGRRHCLELRFFVWIVLNFRPSLGFLKTQID